LPEQNVNDLITSHLRGAVSVIAKLLENEPLLSTLVAASETTARAMLAGRKLMVAGNGGSAADAQHLAAEFIGRLTVDRPAMRAIALTTDTSILTAVGNDYGYESIFSRQLEGLGQPGDVFLGISTSGNSPNILKAMRYCRSAGITPLGLTGHSGGEMTKICDQTIVVPSEITAHIQESHLVLEHIFCTLVERCYFGSSFPVEPAPQSRVG
jgi:D-sedoheptulose 7-phosphate isomerase